MIRFILQRLGFYLLAGMVAVTANFFIPRLMPGDPATVMFARFKGKLEPEALEAMKAGWFVRHLCVCVSNISQHCWWVGYIIGIFSRAGGQHHV